MSGKKDDDAKSAGSEKWKNALRRDIEWEKDDLMEVLYWLRQVVAIALGIVWAVVPLTGFMGNVGFVAYNFVSSLLFYLYYAKFLNVDEEAFGRWELLSEGFMPALSLFLLSWISTYTLIVEG